MNQQYLPGTRLDLTYLNRSHSQNGARKSGFQESAQNLFEVGTRIVFNQGKAWRKIQVVSL